MYSDALQIMDRNTERYMIDKLKKQYEKQKAQYEKQLERQKTDSDAEIQRLREELARYKNAEGSK